MQALQSFGPLIFALLHEAWQASWHSVGSVVSVMADMLAHLHHGTGPRQISRYCQLCVCRMSAHNMGTLHCTSVNRRQAAMLLPSVACMISAYSRAIDGRIASLPLSTLVTWPCTSTPRTSRFAFQVHADCSNFPLTYSVQRVYVVVHPVRKAIDLLRHLLVHLHCPG
jgi:hypothetical protein